MGTTSFVNSFLLQLVVFFAVIQTVSWGASVSNIGRLTASFDSDWRFLKGDAPGAEAPEFDDHSWRRLDVPHDWSIEGPFDEKNPTSGAGGFLPAGVGWYRKYFVVSSEQSSRRFFIEFDGVMANSEVWLNGFSLGKRPYGYVSFCYELTEHLRFGSGQTNVLAVRADNSAQPASRWYAGAGIYRHVRLISTSPVHTETWSTFVTTPSVGADSATVHVSTSVTNQVEGQKEVSMEVVLFDPKGKPVQTITTAPQLVASGKAVDLECETNVDHPRLWSLEQPVLYRAAVKVLSKDRTVLDNEEVPFGIRQFKFEPATGFWLNGKNFKLKGVCLHHEAGGLGAAVPLGAWERRLTVLKQIGCNAIRTSHNPVAPEFLGLCDRMGFIVMDEMFDCWTVGKNKFDYHLYFNDWSKEDARDTVRRDRNHPSVVIYSAGNEIHDTPKAELAKGILKGLVEVFHENDPTRPVTQALFRPNVSHDYDDGLADMLDVIGQNYRENEILAAHEAKPERKIVGTENGHDRKVWLALRDNPPYAGQFLWTGIDYLGESRRWPTVAAGSGLLDRTGTPRARGFERQSWWSDQPMVHMVRRLGATSETPADPGFNPLTRRQLEFSDWTPRNREPHQEEVEVYSNCEEVELFSNGKSLGSKSLPADASPRSWQVSFAPGAIKAVGKNHGRSVATHELRTSGPAAKVLLSTEHTRLTPVWDDVCYVKATVVDSDNVPVPDADPLITFNLAGPGFIVAVDSGDNTSHEPFQASQRHAFHGTCFAILKASAAKGQLSLTASAPGLKPGSVAIKLGQP
jgi:beta-galactosidase